MLIFDCLPRLSIIFHKQNGTVYLFLYSLFKKTWVVWCWIPFNCQTCFHITIVSDCRVSFIVKACLPFTRVSQPEATMLTLKNTFRKEEDIFGWFDNCSLAWRGGTAVRSTCCSCWQYDLVPSTHMVVYNCLKCQSQETNPSSVHMHVIHTHMCGQSTPTHKTRKVF